MVVDLLADDALADRVFNALADPTRRDLVRRALLGDHSVSALARSYPMTVTAVQKHVAVLERAGIVRKERRGREQIVHAEIETVRAASHLLERLEALWRERLDRLGALLDE
jgi:DNA-binding transcriptional ArsR family regulator